MNWITLLRKNSYKILTGLFLIGFISGCQKEISDLQTEDNQGTLNLKGAKVTNFMVITKSETIPSGFENTLSAFGQIVQSIPEIGVTIVKPTVSDFKQKVSRISQVLAVVPDLVSKWGEPVRVGTAPKPLSIGDDETFFKYQWALDAIDAPEAWDAGFTGQGARVFILDSGIDGDNPDLKTNLNKDLSTSFVPGEGYQVREGRYFNHGTHVAGIIAAADNKWGVIGVAPNAEIVAVKVMSEYTGSGAFSWINAGIVYAANNGADVINMSLAGTFFRNGYYYDENDVLQKESASGYQFLILSQQRAINYALKKGATVVVSAGNDSMNGDGNAFVYTLPADLENVIAVSATAPECWMNNPAGSLDIPASYTNYGKSLVALAAPGGDFDCADDDTYVYDMVISTIAGPDPVNNRWYFSFAAGTSQAAPHVAGVAALIIGKNGGQMDPHEVMKQLFKTADKIGGSGISPWYGNGRVNAFRAVTE